MTKPINKTNQKIDINSTTPMVCESCGGELFSEAVMFRKVSALLTETGQEGLLPISVMYCLVCKTIPSQFLPNELKPLIKSISIVTK